MNIIRWYYLRKQKPQRETYKRMRQQAIRIAKEDKLIAKDNWSIYKQLGDKPGAWDFKITSLLKRQSAMRVNCRKDKEFTWMLAGSSYMQRLWNEFGGSRWLP